MQLSKTLVAAALAAAVEGHMSLSYPTPFRSKDNPHANPSTIDYSMTSPLNSDGSNFPCKGYQTDFGTAAGASVATWTIGATHNFSVTGGAFHNGGSCQASLSFDKGASFTVIHSYIGNCPTASGGSFNFVIPPGTPTGDAIFAWSWLNEVGNREYYMNCAAVTIAASASKKRDSSSSFSSRPGIFVANLGNGCTITEGEDAKYPDPGPDVTDTSTKPGTPVGTCNAIKGIGGSSASSSSSGSSVVSSPSSVASSAYSSSQAAEASSVLATVSPGVFVTSSTALSQAPSGFTTSYTSNVAASSAGATASSAAPSSSPATGNSTTSSNVSSDGSCTGTYTCHGSPSGPCCSQYGWCGVTTAHCETGCNSLKGTCGMNSSSSSATFSSASGSYNPSSDASAFSVKTATIMETTTVTVTDGSTGQVTVVPVHSSSTSTSASVSVK